MSAAESDRNSSQGAPGQDDPDALVEEINRTRAELGDTVEALVAKADVKTRAQQRAAEVSTQAKEKLHAFQQQRGAQRVAGATGRYRVPFATGAAAVAGLLAGWLAVRRRRR